MVYYLDGYLKDNLIIAKSKVRDDWDFVFCVDGTERGGKSTLAQQIAKFVDDGFDIDSIVFTPEQFEDAIKVASPFSAVVYDEAYGGLGSRSTMSRVNRTLVKMLTEIGFKNLFVIIVLPSFFDLDKYVALWRCRALFHVYTGNNWERGFFMCFNKERSKDLYVLGKKFYNYSVVKANFYGRFVKHYVVDKDAYVRKKRDAQDSNDVKSLLDEREVDDLLFERLVLNEDLSHKDRMRALGMIEPTYYAKLRRFKTDNIK